MQTHVCLGWCSVCLLVTYILSSLYLGTLSIFAVWCQQKNQRWWGLPAFRLVLCSVWGWWSIHLIDTTISEEWLGRILYNIGTCVPNYVIICPGRRFSMQSFLCSGEMSFSSHFPWITSAVLHESYEIWNFSLCNLLRPVTPTVICPNVFLCVLYSQDMCNRPSFRVKRNVACPANV